MVKFCSLYSGSSGNSIYIGTEHTKLLIDAGVSEGDTVSIYDCEFEFIL